VFELRKRWWIASATTVSPAVAMTVSDAWL
jgi:hypothetical protein